MNKEQKFYNILQDLFVGAKLEGDSGYVNLMNIKTDYFNKIRERIKKEVEAKFKGSQPEDLFDRLYTFFDSYFSDGGAIFFSSTPVYKNIYAKVYSDREDTALFWKTAKLYYVKSEANYKSIKDLSINADPEIAFDFDFDASLLKHKQSNEKKELEFYFIGTQKRKNKKIIKFRVLYKNDNKYSQLESILKIKGRDKVIKYLLDKIGTLKNPKITISNKGLEYTKLSDKSAKDKAKAEFIVSENKDLHDSVAIEPAISETKEIEKYLKLKGIFLGEEAITKAFKIYKKQTEIDYFIHKDAKGFLREQFDLYMYQHLANNMDTVFDQETLDREKKIKEIAYLAIEFIGNFEDELKKIWLKPKFARNSNYVVTLDRVAHKKNGIEVIKEIINHKGMDKQIAEWQEFKIVDKKFDKKVLVKDGKLNKDFQYLPLDTKYFKNLEVKILELFENLDEELDGRLIKSDNFQALNSLLPKYKEQVQTIYIDPPFNLGENADFDYMVNYKDSTWATLLENRLNLAKDVLNEKGNIFVRCDDNGNWIVRSIMDQLFSKNSFKNEIILNRFQKKSGAFTTTTESLFLYARDFKPKFLNIIRSRQCVFCKTKVEPKWQWAHSAGESSIPKYFIVDGKRTLLYPPKGRHWTNSQEKIDDLTKNGQIRINKELSYTDTKSKKINFIPERLQDVNVEVDNNWTDIPGYVFGVYSKEKFSTQNADEVLERVILSTSDENDICFDFFLGSGTTTALAHKLNRKWIGVEMGEQFSIAIIPRMKRVLADKEKNAKKIENYFGGGFFKYYELEQYEDALKRAVYNPTEKELESINFSFSEKQAAAGLEINLKKEKARFMFEKLYPDVDIAETISNLFGKKIKKVTTDKVIFEDESEIDLNNLDFEKYKSLKELIYW